MRILLRKISDQQHELAIGSSARTETFVSAIQERLRGLLGAWKATPHGETMTLDWKS